MTGGVGDGERAKETTVLEKRKSRSGSLEKSELEHQRSRIRRGANKAGKYEGPGMGSREN